jgi:hypothetical protein
MGLTLPIANKNQINSVYNNAYIPDMWFFSVSFVDKHAKIEYPIYADKESYLAGKPAIDKIEINVPTHALTARSQNDEEIELGNKEGQDPEKWYSKATGEERELWYPAFPGFDAIVAALAPVLGPFRSAINNMIFQRGEFKNAKSD